jgi:hypothetical protein
MGRPRTSLCCSVLARKTIHRTSEEVWSCSSVNGQPVRFFRFFSFARFSFASALRIASFGTVSTIRSALLIRSRPCCRVLMVLVLASCYVLPRRCNLAPCDGAKCHERECRLWFRSGNDNLHCFSERRRIPRWEQCFLFVCNGHAATAV